MTLRDFKGLKNKNLLEFIESENVFDDYYTIKLKTDDKTDWRPGEHAIFTLPGSDVRGRKWRAFSVASSSQEGYILIGTRTHGNISSFKEKLIGMSEGDKVKVIGPFGWFVKRDDTSPIVFIAGGVGITPVRALIKQLENDKSRKVEIVHSSDGGYLFADELSQIAQNNPKIVFHKTAGRETTRQLVAELAQKYKNNAYYYISGSFDIITLISKALKKQGIKGKRLVHDPFLGY